MKKRLENSEKFAGQCEIESGVTSILAGLQKMFKIDLSEDNFLDTPSRVARSYFEILDGYSKVEELDGITEVEFPSSYDGMVIATDIKCFSFCPHHLLPVEYVVNCAYIPGTKTVGISKLSRVVEILAKRLVLQEVFTVDIVNYLNKHLKPKGVIAQVRGRHFCMVMRGVKKDSWTITSSLTGIFGDAAVRQEFQSLCANHL